MAKEKHKKTARINLKVTPQFKERAETRAAEEKRTLSSFIEVTVEKELDKKDDEWLNG